MTNTYDTSGEPLGSTAVKVLYNNASNLDDAVNSQEVTWVDRPPFNRVRKTLFGMEQDFNQFLLNTGFENPHLIYVDGVPLQVDRPTQIVERAGFIYRVKMPAVFPVMLTGNWTTDQLLLVDVTDASLRQDLAEEAGAGMVGFALNQVYAAESIGYQLLRANPKRVSAASMGILPNTGLDLSAAFQAVLAAGVAIDLAEGEYLWSLTGTMPMEGPPGFVAWRAVEMVTAPKWYGAGKKKTIIKLMDNQSTDAAPKFFNMLGGNIVLEGIVLSGITFDCNGANNKISPNRALDSYNPYNCAHMMISGSAATVGADARASNSTLINCEFINTPGVTSLAFGQRFGHSGVKGAGNRVLYCDFHNNGNDSADHSSIYLFCDDSLVAFNTFNYPVPSTGRGGPVCCVENFGSNNQILANKFKNYLQFMWVGAGEEGQHHDILIALNQGRTSFRFVDTWSFGPQNDGLGRLMVIANQHTMTADPIGVGVVERIALNLNMLECDLIGVQVWANDFICQDRTNNLAIAVTPSASRLITDILLGANKLKGYSRNIACGGPGTVLDATLVNNKITDCAATSTRVAADTRGIEVLGANFTFSLIGNVINDGDLGALPGTAISLGGTLASLHMDSNAARGSVSDIADSASVSGRRTGAQARRFATPPTVGTWKAGDTIDNTGRTELGDPLSKYVIEGWFVATDIVNPTLGSWIQRRCLTGN